jgi:arylsulfatase A-like enzyme
VLGESSKLVPIRDQSSALGRGASHPSRPVGEVSGTRLPEGDLALLRKLIDSPWLYFSLAGLLLVVALISQVRFSPPPRLQGTAQDLAALDQRDDLNVVFIVIDMLRADRLHTYGYSRQTSPVMDGLAASGIRFANVESQSSWTKASMASMWTGMYPERTGIQRFYHAVPEEAQLPAEIFKEAGYRTAGIWRNGWVANNFGFGQGFDLYIRPRQNRPEHEIRRHNPGVRGLPGTDMDATLAALEFMTGSVSEKFFLYIHYMDVHQYLYADLSPDFGTSFSDFYDSSIFWTDHNVGRVMQGLQDLRISDRTLVVIVSDHGEAFFEHGIEGHARNLYREVLTTPWIIVPPFDLEPGIVVEERVGNVDVWPTLLDMLGLPPLPGAEGQSALPLVLAAQEGDGTIPVSPDSDRAIFAQLDRSWGRVGQDSRPTSSVVKGRHRLNYYGALGAEPERVELYDHSVDPLEKKNVASGHLEIVSELSQEVQDFLARPKTQWDEAPEVEIDEMRAQQLRALGYVVQPRKPKPAERGESGENGAPEANADGS